MLLIASTIFATAGAQTQKELRQLMRERGEYYFTLTVEKPTQIQAISEICSVDATDGKTVVAYANQKEYDRLLKAGYKPELQTPPSMRANVTMWNGQGTYNWDSYLTYPQYVSMMDSFPTKAISGRECTLFSLGTLSTSNHRQLLGVRINNGSPAGKPKFLYTSTMHGDEITGMILMLRLIDELCTNTTDSQIADLVNNLDIYIMPLTNPDGTYNGGNNTVNNAKRYNGHNVDLNRNYKDYYKGAHPDGNSYEDETVWTMAMGDENLFTMSANYHGGAEVMNYPWDAVYDDHADKDWYEYVCTQYVQIARQTYSSYMSDTYSDGVTNGADWYVITGSRQDYMNAYGQCREVTVECSTTKTPSASSLPSFWNYNRNSMLAFMEQCLKGVHGFVYDAVTGDALEGVKVTVEGHDSETSFVTSHSIGDFHRPIKGGTYTFTFSKQGYYPQSVQVTVADGQRVDLNIQLQPNLTLNADFTASTTDVSLGQSISFSDTSEGMVNSWSWSFEGATPSSSTEQNPTGITYNTPGDYDVTMTVTGPGGTQTVTKENYIHVAESILMQNGSVTTCSGIFYDSGGPNDNYGNNLNYTMTFYPGTEGAMVNVNFTKFNTESGYDYLYIYNGTSTSATQIGRYDGTTSPGTVMATNEAGALTFKFTSDSGVNAAGWIAMVSCIYTDQPVNISVTANPSKGGTVSGGGEYNFAETCTVVATPKEGYTFMGWTENEEVVSNDLEYSFSAINDRELVANFAHTTMVEIGENQTTSYFLPSYSYYKQSLTQQIYTAEEIGTVGTIKSIAFFNEATTARTRSYDFYIKATDKSSFTSKTDWITVASTDKVFSGSVTMTAGDWTTIIFDTPFEYDGTSNLVLVADDNTGRYDNSPYMACSVYNTSSNQAIYIYSDNNNYSPMSPPTSSIGGGTNEVLTVKNHIILGIETDNDEEQTFNLSQGWNWWSTYLDITLADLKAALEAVLPNGTIVIKAQDGKRTTYNGSNWKGQLSTLDVKQMYEIQVSGSCSIILDGAPVNPADNAITLYPNGYTWIAYSLNESLSVGTALQGIQPAPENGDMIKAQNGFASFNGSSWKGSLKTLEPGKGYIYKSTSNQAKTLTYTNSSEK